MNLYAESSAVLAWLLDQPRGLAAIEEARTADLVVTSELTMIECDRAILREVATGRLIQPRAGELRTALGDASAAWDVAPIGAEVVARARASFPDDAVRALDAIHLATAVTARASLGDIAILTLDSRIRETGLALGFRVLPG